MGGYTRLYAVGIFRYDVRPLVESNLAKKPHRTVAAAARPCEADTTHTTPVRNPIPLALPTTTATAVVAAVLNCDISARTIRRTRLGQEIKRTRQIVRPFKKKRQIVRRIA